ncbi:hypothetical protein [uncultured Pontibacter sp.]|uniref:hypothetical protein n=1 Tax=uncultured Pontibacter sp. TaxID=453356 RepID=UPI00263141BD|nr:hypothetical protein [uncultured Pontibacter sp.]
MKKFLFVAFALFAASCSADNNLEDALYNVVETTAEMALDSLNQVVDKELKSHTGIDSLGSRIRATDTLNVEREVKRELIRVLSE